MYKNIVITGPGRSGKTTLAKMISSKYGYSIISIDDILVALEELPEIQYSWKKSTAQKAELISPFLTKYISELSEGKKFYEGYKSIIEGSDVDIDSLMQTINKETTLLIGLTYNERNKDSMFKTLKKYDTNADWTHYLDDEQLKGCCDAWIESNRDFDSKFKEYGIPSFDVSYSRDEILNGIVNNLEDLEKGNVRKRTL